jgi:hypothetical protein
MALHQSKKSVKYLRSEIFHGFPGGVDGALSNEGPHEMKAMK